MILTDEIKSRLRKKFFFFFFTHFSSYKHVTNFGIKTYNNGFVLGLNVGQKLFNTMI